MHKLIRNRLTIPFMPFYQRYPYRNGISINSADARGCIDLKAGFFCNRIPKAANSTVVTTLARISHGENVPSRDAKKMYAVPSQLTREQVAELEHLFKFAVVRNPFTRTLSAYLDKIERWPKRNKKIRSFREFLEGLQTGKLLTNAHWAPQATLLLLPPNHFDYFGKVESLEKDLAFIRSQLLGQSYAPEPVRSATGHATGAKDRLRSYYDNECIQIVQTLYKDDFDLFNYLPDFPV